MRRLVDEFSQKLVDEIRNFTSGHPQNDDITFVVIKEKKKYDELEYEKRRMLFDMVELSTSREGRTR